MSDSLPVPATLDVVAMPHPFSMRRVRLGLEGRLSVAEIVARVQPDPALRRRAHVIIDGTYIPRELWETTYPRAGAQVAVRVVPQGFVAAVFVAVAGLLAATAVKALLVPIVGTLIATGIGALVGIGVTLIGTLIIRALIPPPHPRLTDQKKDPSVYFVEGARNDLKPYAPVPCVLGRHRMYPPFCARPYTEVRGNDQYLYLLLCWGYGPVQIEDMRIGETPIGDYKDISIQTRYGYPNEPPLTLYSNSVYEEPLSIVLKQSTGWHERTSQENADRLSVDVTFFRGLFKLNDNGGRSNRTVEIEIQYRPIGGGWISRPIMSATAKSMEPVRLSDAWDVSPGQYEVRLRRITADTDSSRIQDEVTWTALRTIRNVYPIDCPADLAVTALRIKATEQLHGIVDTVNAIVSKLIPDWDKTTQTWVTRATSNPASIYRYILQGPQNHQALSDDQIDLDALQRWHEFCADKGFEFNTVKDWSGDVEELLAMVAAAGRASPTYVDGKRSIIIDTEQAVPVQLFTPRNSWGFTGERLFVDIPHGFRCRFPNRDKDWKQDEVIVYDDGYGPSNATKFEEMLLPGVTSYEQVYKLARYHLAVARLRPEVYKWYCDAEHLVCTRGDLVRVQHDVTLWGLSAGRIKRLITNKSGWLTGLEVDEICPMEEGKSYNLRVRLLSEQSVYQVITEPGEQTVINLSEPVAPVSWPNVGDLFVFGESATESVDLLITAIEPAADLTAQITAVPYDPAIYEADSGPIPPWDSHITIPQEWWVPIIDDIRSDGSVLYLTPDNTWVSRILVAYRLLSGIAADIVNVEAEWWRKDEDGVGPYLTSAPYRQGYISLMPVEDGVTYQIRLRFVKASGARGPWSDEVEHTVVGKTAPPSDVTGLYAYQVMGAVTIVWDEVPDRDIWGYEIRYGSPGCAWDLDYQDVKVLTKVLRATSFTTNLIMSGTWDIMVKAVDTSGNYSINEARYRLTVIQYYAVVKDMSWHPMWAGTMDGWARDNVSGYLESADQLSADGDDYIIFDEFVSVPYDNQYYETPELDLGEEISGRTWYIMDYKHGAGEPIGNAPIVEFDCRSDGGNYDGWEQINDVLLFTGRYVKYRVKLANANGDGQVYITQFQTIVDKF